MIKEINETRCIITSASNKFFPSLLNLLGSIEENYPNHPDVYIYNLGLFFSFRKQLESIPWVHILDIPHFVPHWRSCYTWKTYIFKIPLTENNLYLDAGNQVLKPLDDVFEKISLNGYLFVSAGDEVKNKDLIPDDYINIFDIKDKTKLDNGILTAGIFGFNKNNKEIMNLTNLLFDCGKIGLCLGFSKNEQWKNKGVNKNNFIRNAKYFRHDNTLFCLLFIKTISNAIIEKVEYFDSKFTDKDNQYIWNLRLNYRKLKYLYFSKKYQTHTLIKIINNIYLYLFLFLKEINRIIKKNKY